MKEWRGGVLHSDKHHIEINLANKIDFYKA